MGRHNTATAAAALVVLVGLGVSACGNDDDSASTGTVAPMAVEVGGGRAGVGVPDEFASDSTEAVGEAADMQAAPGTLLVDTSGQALAIRAGVTIGSSDIRGAVDDTLVAVQRNNARVFSADVNIGDELDDGSVDGSGWFVVQVPPTDLEPLIADLGATVGEVTGRTQDSADVTDQLVDLDIRIGVERDVIERFQALLTEATAFDDIVAIERVISERTIALEQLLASQRNLENRVEFSTLTIELQYVATPTAPVEDDSVDTIAEAWQTGWDVFVGALFAIGFVLAVATPFLLAALLVFGVVWLVSRRISRRRSTPTAAAASAETGPGSEPIGPSEVSSTDDSALAAPTHQA